MKRIFALMLALCLALTLLAGCGEKDTPDTPDDAQNNVGDNTIPEDAKKPAKFEGVMTYDEYVAAALDTEVTVETYVQAKQSWWDDKATVYSQDKDGAYFLYNMACSAEDYEKLVPGTKIKVVGFKGEWSGEVEIMDATFEIIEDDTFVATAEDVTALLGTDELINKQNLFVAFKGMTVESYTKDGTDYNCAFVYNDDNSGSREANGVGSDLYFNVSVNGQTYTFCVESYLCNNESEVYKAVESLNVGDVIDAEGFLYWYNGANPHITAVSAAQ